MTQQDDFARRVAATLNQGLRELDVPTGQRLASMRRQALAEVHLNGRNHTVLAWAYRHARMGIFLALALLMAGWWFMQNTPRAYSPETDILLLTGELPPNVYADNAFSQWLEARTNY
jgi:multidrug efflux pump subunit AcrB